MEETNDYWLFENKLIFKPHFNETLSKYYYYDNDNDNNYNGDNNQPYTKISTNYNHLIFSNYLEFDICIKNQNQYIYSLDKYFLESKFTQKIIVPSWTTILIFGYSFNQTIQLNNNLTHLIFDYWFNQPIQLNNNLTYLILGVDFNQQILLPRNLKHIRLNCNNNIIDLLHDNIEILELGPEFN